MGEQVREIKFRAWNGKEMFNVDVLAISPCAWDCPDYGKRGASLAYQPHIRVMQYTGMKDKNSVEIYEGDILRCKVTKRFFKHEYDLAGETETIFKLSVIEWWESFSNIGYRLRDTRGKTMMVKPSSLYKMEVEVIGNIHENPELLEVK